jgi:impB/mucB/samB family C-terminal domain
VTVRVRFADLRSVTRSVTLDAPISATAILAEIAEELVRTVLALHPEEGSISLLSISVSHLEKDTVVQLELPLGLEDEGAGLAARKAWRVGRPIALSTRSAPASGGERWDMDRWPWDFSIPFRTSFECSPNRSSDYAIRYFPKAHLCCSCRRGGGRGPRADEWWDRLG